MFLFSLPSDAAATQLSDACYSGVYVDDASCYLPASLSLSPSQDTTTRVPLGEQFTPCRNRLAACTHSNSHQPTAVPRFQFECRDLKERGRERGKRVAAPCCHESSHPQSANCSGLSPCPRLCAQPGVCRPWTVRLLHYRCGSLLWNRITHVLRARSERSLM